MPLEGLGSVRFESNTAHTHPRWFRKSSPTAAASVSKPYRTAVKDLDHRLEQSPVNLVESQGIYLQMV